MKKIFSVVIAIFALQFAFISCQNTDMGNKSITNDSVDNKGIYTEYQYTFYETPQVNGEGLGFCGISKQIFKDGAIEYHPYMNFYRNYNNTYSLDCLSLCESDLSLMIDYIDSCMSYKPSTSDDKKKNIRCKFGSQDRCADFVYGADGHIVVIFEVNRYTLGLKLTDIRNIVSGLKVKVEALKKED